VEGGPAGGSMPQGEILAPRWAGPTRTWRPSTPSGPMRPAGWTACSPPL